ncbi:DUF1320 domain-containing protein [Spongiimicrobium salis]|uniref:DUF1320 domain-containing protein n=1 Tax=Spongiimicrobium salis TaxID=1667022 RepID=UPI00374D7FF2
MAFLRPEDYTVQIRQWVTNILTDGGDTILERAEMSAQEEMESYLNARYDVAKVFDPEQVEGDRNALVVMYMVDIAVYHMHSNITPSDIPEIRKDRYDNAMAWLKKVADGKITPNLPQPEIPEGEEDPGSFEFQGGSNDKTSFRY